MDISTSTLLTVLVCLGLLVVVVYTYRLYLGAVAERLIVPVYTFAQRTWLPLRPFPWLALLLIHTAGYPVWGIYKIGALLFKGWSKQRESRQLIMDQRRGNLREFNRERPGTELQPVERQLRLSDAPEINSGITYLLSNLPGQEEIRQAWIGWQPLDGIKDPKRYIICPQCIGKDGRRQVIIRFFLKGTSQEVGFVNLTTGEMFPDPKSKE